MLETRKMLNLEWRSREGEIRLSSDDSSVGTVFPFHWEIFLPALGNIFDLHWGILLTPIGEYFHPIGVYFYSIGVYFYPSGEQFYLLGEYCYPELGNIFTLIGEYFYLPLRNISAPNGEWLKLQSASQSLISRVTLSSRGNLLWNFWEIVDSCLSYPRWERDHI